MPLATAPSSLAAPAPKAASHRTSLRLYLPLSGVLAVAVYFSIRDVLPYLSLDEATYGPYWWGRVSWLFPHVLAGMLALLLGPLQFLTALRRRYARVHRWSGRVYLASVGVASVMAAFMIAHSTFNYAFRSGLAGLVFAWVSTSALALVAIRRGNVPQHREWMIRSYVVTFGFVIFRVVDETLSGFGLGTFDERIALASWSCWAVPLLVTELIIQGRKLLRAPRRALPELT
jgi:uncharacterized membrane protein